MAKSSEKLRDEEREIETEAAFAGGGPNSSSDDSQYLIPDLMKIDSQAVAEKIANEAAEDGGSSGPGAGFGGGDDY